MKIYLLWHHSVPLSVNEKNYYMKLAFQQIMLGRPSRVECTMFHPLDQECILICFYCVEQNLVRISHTSGIFKPHKHNRRFMFCQNRSYLRSSRLCNKPVCEISDSTKMLALL